MSNSKVYRQRAADCVRLARGAEEFYVKTALFELAQVLNNKASELERREQHMSARTPARRFASHTDTTTQSVG